jgi:drug/metabolite transporter (DMT)-like permease
MDLKSLPSNNADIANGKEEVIVENVKGKYSSLLRLRGYFLALFSSIVNAISNILIRKAHLFSGSEQSFIRYLLSLFILLALAVFWKKLNIFGEKPLRPILIARGIAGSMGVISITFAFKLINPSDATAIMFSNIIVVSILARIFLKEKMSIACIFSIVLCIAGLIMITQPSFLFKKTKNLIVNETIRDNTSNITNTSDNLNDNNESIKTIIGILLALCCVMFSSTVQIILKKLANQKVHFSVTNLFACYAGLPTTLIISVVLVQTGYKTNPLLILNDLQDHKLQIFYSIAAALLGLLSQTCMIVSYLYEDAIKLSILKTIELPFTFLFQYIILRIIPNYYSSIGAVLIVTASLSLLAIKYFDARNMKKMASIEEAEQMNSLLNVNNKDKSCDIKKSTTRILFYKF